MDDVCRENFLVKHFFFLSIVLCCFSYSPLIHAQSTINSSQFIEQYLSVAEADFRFSDTISSFSAPWIGGLEFRTQTNDFDLDQQRYVIRLRPTSKKIRSGQQRIVQLLEEAAAIKRAHYFDDVIQQAYEDWLEVHTLHQQQAIYRKQLVVYQDIEKVLFRMGQYEDLNIKELLEVQTDITATRIRLETIQKNIANYIGTKHIAGEDLLSIETIQQIIQTTSESSVPIQAAQISKVALVQAEIDLEKAEQQNIFDFVQLRYEGPTVDPWEERMAIGASFNIPYTKKGNLKEAELQIEKLLLEEEIQLERKKIKEKVSNLKQATVRIIEEYELSQRLLAEQQNRTAALIAKTAHQRTTSPLLELYQQIEQNKQSLDLLKLKSAIYQKYIDYLEETGLLFERPFHNFLTSSSKR